MALNCGATTIATVIASACAVISLVLGALSWSRTTSLYLPLPQWLPGLATFLPAITALALVLTHRLPTTGAPHHRFQTLLPILSHIHSILSTLVAAVALAYLYPENILNCRLDQEWLTNFRTRNAEPIRTIQDHFRCCGLRSIHDRAWPFKDRTHGDDACEVQLGYGQSCLVPWMQQQQGASWMVFAAAVLVLVMKVGFYQATRPRTSWMGRTFGRRAQEYRRIAHPELQDGPELRDEEGEAEEGRAILPRGGERYENEWNERPKQTPTTIAQTAPQPRRRRGLVRRTRTGCRTCQIRRIKCDETLPHCMNCTSTGRVCDGYPLFQLPVLPPTRPLPTTITTCSLTNATISTPLPGLTASERRCFSFFQHHTVPMMVSFFDSSIWQCLILQLSHSEPAVSHAVAALGAMHEVTSARRGDRVRARAADYRYFALEQYGRAISLLLKRPRGSNDPAVRLTVLVCCMIFVFFEFVRGDYRVALMHLRNGLRVLGPGEGGRNWRGAGALMGLDEKRKRGEGESEEEMLIRGFAHLDIQCAHWDPAGSVIALYPTMEIQVEDFEYTRDLRLGSLREAKNTIDPIVNNTIRFWTVCEMGLRAEGGGSGVEALVAERNRLRRSLAQHARAFEEFVAGFVPKQLKEVRAVALIRLHHVILGMNVATFLNLSEMVYDEYAEEWERAVGLGERIVESFREEFGALDRFPNVIMDMGMILPLTWMGMRCRDPGYRMRVLRLLGTWPHREGPEDSTTAVVIVREVMRVESEAVGADGVVPERARVRTAGVEKMGDGRRAVLRYALSDPEGPLVMQRRVFNLDDD
ncbi:hypothetical protein BO71DRAFT_449792 [Aspergillus ellipticus CBS 707.79]|uniref:Zn(2)-C6 fungal-type domain-containing protein n=1 Tax=Aspergillus ellipticus CBS 707.79 TaxID=1448320 RepID=A0A319DC33_9EURO|nr:hypothetical protein BO71DRAFT_449792 [Aspergillus ellipticus CBS 707.79]